MTAKMEKPWKVVRYSSCPDCTCWSLGVRADGRFVRHSISCGSVERLRPGSPFRPTPICAGSGKKAPG